MPSPASTLTADFVGQSARDLISILMVLEEARADTNRAPLEYRNLAEAVRCCREAIRVAA